MLQTSSYFQVVDYDFVDVYITANITSQTPVHNSERRETINGFELIEWICKNNEKDVDEELFRDRIISNSTLMTSGED